MTLRTVFAAVLAAVALPIMAADPVLPSATTKSAPLPATTLTVASVDVRTLVDEDSKALGQALRYGVQQRVDQILLGAGGAGNWQPLADGRLLWSGAVSSEGAVSLDLHFARFQLPDGAELFLADRGGDYVLGPIRGSDALADGQFHSPLIPGDLVRIEVVVADHQRDQVQLNLAAVTYGYRGLFGLGDHADAARSGSCNIDVVCPLGSGWGDQIDSVGQYIFTSGASSFVCTGSLIGNTGGTPIPYFLTANHCVSTNTVAQTMRVYWNYQSPTCRTPGSPASGQPLPRPATFSNGATLRMTYASNDTSLVEMNAPVPLVEDPFFVGWDRRNLGTPGNPQVSGAITIHHPAGHEKRISRDADALTVTSYLGNTALPAGSHYRIGNWEEGTTEGGSSGSALYTPAGHLIGTLHGGYASCSSITQDWYGRIHQSWAGGGTDATRLSNWLDPAGTAPETFNGYRGEPLDQSDLAIALSAVPDPVDIGGLLNLVVDVDNNGPDDATGVTLSVQLPPALAYSADGGGAWTCTDGGSNIDCSLTGTLANGATASIQIVTVVDSGAQPGTITVDAAVDSDSNDPVPANDSASVDVEVTGTPDIILRGDFECAEGFPGCGNPDIVVGTLDATIPDDFGGLSVNWLTGDAIPGEIAGYHFNPYRSDTAGLTVLSFWWGMGDVSAAGASDGTNYLVLQSGATIGPASNFITTPQGAPTVNWRQAGGVDGYLGFRFTNTDTGEVNYGWVRMTTTGTDGFPATLIDYAYNQAGDPITIP